MFRRTLLILLSLVVLGGGLLFYWVQDANRFKPELEDLIEAQAGVPVKINGDLAWRLLPPLSLTAGSVSAERHGQQWTAGNLALDVDVMTVVRTRDINQWRVQALRLNDVTMTDASGRLDMAALDVRDFAVGSPAPVSTTLTYTPAQGAPIPLELTALVTYHADPERISIRRADFSTNVAPVGNAAGICDLEATPVAGSPRAQAPREGELIPVGVWRSFDWQGSCDLARFTFEGQRFDNATLELSNRQRNGENTLSLPEFFGGSARLNVSIDARNDPVRWIVAPDLQGVDSQRLMAWLDQRFHWIAPLAYGGSLTFEGNTRDELMASVSGATTFDGGTGAISIAKIKQPLLAVATLLQEPEKIEGLPDIWDYESFTGNWRIDRQRHNLDLALDNLTVLASGDYDPVRDEMDMLAELTFATVSEGRMFEVNPLLMDLPIPVRCTGKLEDPKCRVDEKAAQQIVASALNSSDGSMREKLEKKIDEQVPEEYREAARGLLDILGEAMQRNAREAGNN